jgi:hypothetical protein
MEAKLIKVEEEWYNLLKSDGELIASDDEDFQHNYKVSKLSTKNCQAIERGYDLNELADEYINKTFPFNEYSNKKYDLTKENAGIDFIAGLQKVFELMGDKKFSEEDIHEAYSLGEREDRSGFHDLLHRKQQKEWDVEIEMEKVKDETKIVGAIKGVKGSGNKITTYKSVPKLDADGCLILKRI